MSHLQPPTVFIVIVNWNGLEDTLQCLASVSKLDYPRRQTVLVDNGSTDGSQARLKAVPPDCTLIEHSANLGYTGGNNAGMRYALAQGADYVWLLNNDTVVEPDSLSKLVASASQDQTIGLISPVTYEFHDRDRIQFRGVFADMSRQTITDAPDPLGHQPDTLSTALLLWGTALFIKSTVIQRIGYLDDRFFAYHEDIDYSLRAINAGFRTLVEPTAVVYHKWAASSGAASPARMFYLTRNWYLFWRTHLKGIRKHTYPAKYLAWALGQAVSFKNESNESTADACLDGAWGALRGRFGPRRETDRMPRTLKRILYMHPYFWMRLFQGEFQAILRVMIGRLMHRG
jgi:GT2 family glycosyltransferase